MSANTPPFVGVYVEETSRTQLKIMPPEVLPAIQRQPSGSLVGTVHIETAPPQHGQGVGPGVTLILRRENWQRLAEVAAAMAADLGDLERAHAKAAAGPTLFAVNPNPSPKKDQN